MTAVLITGAGSVVADAKDANGDWFDPVPYLGPRGWKYLTPATRFLLAAAGLALADAHLVPEDLPDESLGVVVGTNFAARPVVGRLDEVVIADSAEMLSPAEAPNFSVNLAASQISMRYAMRAFNLTLTNPVVAGVESVLTLAGAIRRGRARAGIAGACEERHPGFPMSEGACCLALEEAGHVEGRSGEARAEVAGGFSRLVPPGGDVETLEAPLKSLLSAAEPPVAYAGPCPDGEFGRLVSDFCLSRPWTELEPDPRLVTDGGHVTVSPLLQVTGLLGCERGGLVVSASPHGHVAALYVAPANRA